MMKPRRNWNILFGIIFLIIGIIFISISIMYQHETYNSHPFVNGHTDTSLVVFGIDGTVKDAIVVCVLAAMATLLGITALVLNFICRIEDMRI